jgi:hypothetical protein
MNISVVDCSFCGKLYTERILSKKIRKYATIKI